MTSDGSTTALGHETAWDLIPWFVNETLSSDELSGFEAHVAGCEACRQEIAAQRRLATELRETPAASADADRGWTRLLAALDAPPQAARRRRLSTRRLLVAAAVLQVALLGTLLGVIGWLHGPRPEPLFHTLSAPTTAQSAEGARLRIVPAPQASVSQLESALLPVRGRIIDGPTSAGVFTIVVPESRREAAIRSLRGQSFILLVEPLPDANP
jgi:hypothetical protein